MGAQSQAAALVEQKVMYTCEVEERPCKAAKTAGEAKAERDLAVGDFQKTETSEQTEEPARSEQPAEADQRPQTEDRAEVEELAGMQEAVPVQAEEAESGGPEAVGERAAR